jgi:uncharacterized protein YecT (DUF1311 family)
MSILMMRPVISVKMRSLRSNPWFATLILSLVSYGSCAIDNPDAPDLVAAFEQRSAKYEGAIQQANDTREMVRTSAEYQSFLSVELDRAYTALVQKIPAESRSQLKASQKRWTLFRDAEFDFIDHNWTFENFGTSSSISRIGFRCSIVRARTIALLRYLQN